MKRRKRKKEKEDERKERCEDFLGHKLKTIMFECAQRESLFHLKQNIEYKLLSLHLISDFYPLT